MRTSSLHSNNRKYKLLSFFVIFCLLLCATTYGIHGKSASEFEVKAAFLYNFTKFVEWPNDNLVSNDYFNICIYGDNPFGEKLEAIVSEKTVHDKPIKIVYTDDISVVKNCQILFAASDNKKLTDSVLSIVDSLPILTVSDLSKFASNGGMIGFYIDHNKVRFEVNRDKAHKSGLSISSRLLKIARIVDDKN